MSADGTALVKEIRVYEYDLTYAHGTYVMSQGREITSLPSVVVAITTADGITGYGEVCPLGTNYLPGFAGGIHAALAELAPALIGADATNLSQINRIMDATLRGHGYAKSAIDVACWDLLGKQAGLPCDALLGGRTQDRFPLYVAVPLGPPAAMASFTARTRDSGIHRFQLKIGGDPRKDADRVRAVVEATGEEDVIIADANGAWRIQDATVAVRLLEALPRVYLEQPCPTIEECLTVRKLTSMPFVLDEVITDLRSLIRCADAGGMEAINLKISRVGGLSAARMLRDVAVELGLRLTIEDTWGGDLTSAAVCQLAASTPVEAFYAASFMNDWNLEHVAGYTPRSKDGWGEATTAAGLGIEVDEATLKSPLARFSH